MEEIKWGTAYLSSVGHLNQRGNDALGGEKKYILNFGGAPLWKKSKGGWE